MEKPPPSSPDLVVPPPPPSRASASRPLVPVTQPVRLAAPKTPWPLVCIGGGEHARVVLEAALSRPEWFAVLGFVDDKPCAPTLQRLGVPRLGNDERGLALLAEIPELRLVLGIGAVGGSGAREAILRRYFDAQARFAAVVHARAYVAPSATLEDGVFVAAGAVVNTSAYLGIHAVVNTGAIVEHDVSLGAFSQVGPGAVLGGGVVLDDHAYVGLGARVRDHVRVGRGAVVGMGAVVTRSVAPGQVVVGVPAVPRKPRP
jgi:acetyltransferase EpsM